MNIWERRKLLLTVGLPTDTFRRNGRTRKSPFGNSPSNTWFRQESWINTKSSRWKFDGEWIVHIIPKYLLYKILFGDKGGKRNCAAEKPGRHHFFYWLKFMWLVLGQIEILCYLTVCNEKNTFLCDIPTKKWATWTYNEELAAKLKSRDILQHTYAVIFEVSRLCRPQEDWAVF